MAAKSTTSDTSSCKQCKQPFENGAHCVACEGFCCNFYHIECVNFTFDELVCYRKLQNVWWICEECRNVMREIKNNDSTPHTEKVIVSKIPNACEKFDHFEKEITTLKEQIAEIHQTIADVSSVHSTKILDTSNEDLSLAQSPVLSSTKLMCGTKNAASLNCSSINRSVLDEKYWLFFTRIKNTVTEREMLKMVVDCLGTEDAAVRKLVPTWKDTANMPFISFKIGINLQFKEIAQRSSTWPAGICFREFRENVWEPTQCN